MLVWYLKSLIIDIQIMIYEAAKSLVNGCSFYNVYFFSYMYLFGMI